MEFNVKGIAFSKENLETISIDDLRINGISPAHLFIFIKEKPFLMLRAGDLITSEFIEKYKNKGLTSFYNLPILNKELYDHFVLSLKRLKTFKARVDRRKCIEELYQKFAFSYWLESDESFLNFAMAAYDVFYHLPQDCISELQSRSQILYARALLSSALVVVNAFVDDIDDFQYLQDLYNTAFVMDIGLIQNGDFNYLMAKACEYERNHPGTGLSWVKSHPNQTYEGDIFYQHPQASYKVAKKYEDHFHYPEILDYILYHHEKTDGSGFPSGISFSGLAYNEVYLMLADYMVPFGEHVFHQGDGFSVVKKAFEALENIEDRYLLPISHLIMKWKSIMKWYAVGEEVSEENIFGETIDKVGEAS